MKNPLRNLFAPPDTFRTVRLVFSFFSRPTVRGGAVRFYRCHRVVAFFSRWKMSRCGSFFLQTHGAGGAGGRDQRLHRWQATGNERTNRSLKTNQQNAGCARTLSAYFRIFRHPLLTILDSFLDGFHRPNRPTLFGPPIGIRSSPSAHARPTLPNVTCWPLI